MMLSGTARRREHCRPWTHGDGEEQWVVFGRGRSIGWVRVGWGLTSGGDVGGRGGEALPAASGSSGRREGGCVGSNSVGGVRAAGRWLGLAGGSG